MTAELGYTRSKQLYHNIIYGTADVVVIADSKTKQILFVNRAGEQYFGKRFDPLTPVTCAEFCGRDKKCESCPAWSIISGERREYVTSENGKHLKTYYTQMDRNGHDAVVYYQIDITAEMQELAFSNALIQNIPGATIAFEMKGNSKPYIRYISDKTLKILKNGGIETDSPNFEDCISVIHPEDADCVRKAMSLTFAEKRLSENRLELCRITVRPFGWSCW